MTVRWLAAGLGGFAVAEVTAAAGLSAGVGWSWRDALEAFVVTNSLMGVAFAVCGAIIAWHRPGNPIGWLFIADGIGHATSAFAVGLGEALPGGTAQRIVVTVFLWSWPWSIGLFLPLALLLFPDGRLPSARWRPVAIGVVATAPLFALEMGSGTPPHGMPSGYLSIPSYDALQPLWTVSEIRTVAAILLGVVSLVVRYRRADEERRRQLLWLLLATIVAVVLMVPWSFIAGTPIVVLFSIPLIPVAVTVAIVRHRLLDIRLVVSRALSWTVLSVAAVAAYAGLVALLDTFISSTVGRSAAVTVIVALLLAPVLPRLQRMVDRAMYGDRRDPARVASRVGEQLMADPAGGLPGVVSAVRHALRLPYVAFRLPDRLVAADGSPGDRVVTVPLEYAGSTVGELLVGLRPGESQLAPADREALGLVAVPLALSAQLQTSRERIVAAREEERRRLRRDLHDGLGPTLTGVAFMADAAANLVDGDTARVRELLVALGTDTRAAISDVRRVVDDLRPPALDELGLVRALRQRAEQMSWRADGAAVRVRVDAPDDLPPLPAAVEVAAYRIATEALTNVVRHSSASSAVVRLRCGDTFDLAVVDDGSPNGVWRPGVGLQAMRERTAELGGRFEAGDGRVLASFPLEFR